MNCRLDLIEITCRIQNYFNHNNSIKTSNWSEFLHTLDHKANYFQDVPKVLKQNQKEFWKYDSWNENINANNTVLNNFIFESSRMDPNTQRYNTQRYNTQRSNASSSKISNTERWNKSHFDKVKDPIDSQIWREQNIPPEFIESKAMHDLNRKYNKLKLLFKKEKKFYRETIDKMARQNEEITDRIFDLELQLEQCSWKNRARNLNYTRNIDYNKTLFGLCTSCKDSNPNKNKNIVISSTKHVMNNMEPSRSRSLIKTEVKREKSNCK